MRSCSQARRCLRVVKDPERFPSLTQVRVGGYADQGLSPEETHATYHNLMQAAMVSLRPTQELYIRHRKELTDPWVGPKRCATGR